MHELSSSNQPDTNNLRNNLDEIFSEANSHINDYTLRKYLVAKSIIRIFEIKNLPKEAAKAATEDLNVHSESSSISFNRHQLLLTLFGYEKIIQDNVSLSVLSANSKSSPRVVYSCYLDMKRFSPINYDKRLFTVAQLCLECASSKHGSDKNEDNFHNN